jgi:hypothetical protein
VILLETPVNPLGTAFSIEQFVQKAHSRGAYLMVDSTFALLGLQGPLSGALILWCILNLNILAATATCPVMFLRQSARTGERNSLRTDLLLEVSSAIWGPGLGFEVCEHWMSVWNASAKAPKG